MARLIINNNVVSGETFLPGQLFVFGGFALRANSIGHLEQIDSYAPGHQISFENLNYVADIRGDLIFKGFTASTTIPHLEEGNPSDPLLTDLLSCCHWQGGGGGCGIPHLPATEEASACQVTEDCGGADYRCQNQEISGRGSRTMRLGGW